MEYADGGTLRNYLKLNFDKLSWGDKYNLAFQLAYAVSCLHDKGIVHLDLHSGNILIHQGVIKLADFGLSKRIESATNQSKVIPYIDPKSFIKGRNNDNTSQQYKLYEKSDVYSVGVLLWELSSGTPPFNEGEVYNIGFAIEITQRLRERIVPDTPEDYEKIYIDCWDNEPDNRPAMIKVVYELYAIITKTNINYHNQMNNEESKFQLSVQQLHLNAANPFSGDLRRFLTENFYDIKWWDKLDLLKKIIKGLEYIHNKGIIHRDFHSGNILCCEDRKILIGDLGISKSSNELTDNNDNNGDKIYGIIPYMAPEVFHGQDYTTASDIYSLGMIMWELMTGRRPFWDHDHDTHLIIRICDNIRPPIVTNAPEGYIELMEKCWHSDPNKRPTANYLKEVVDSMISIEINNFYNNKATNIISSSEIGPVATNHSEAIYKSRSLSNVIRSAILSRSQSVTELDPFVYYQKHDLSFNDKSTTDDLNNENKGNKKNYLTKELEIDINANTVNINESNEEYLSREIDIDINLNVKEI
ncbi:19462_t:CDS:2 [Funneliformis geosporum]|nr:19462_t:CDS:2 [Funneliformis geosporum]